MNRKELYKEVRSLALQDEIKHLFGKNFTNCTTSDLEKAVSKAKRGMENIPKAKKDTEENRRLETLVHILYSKRILLKSEMENILNK